MGPLIPAPIFPALLRFCVFKLTVPVAKGMLFNVVAIVVAKGVPTVPEPVTFPVSVMVPAETAEEIAVFICPKLTPSVLTVPVARLVSF